MKDYYKQLGIPKNADSSEIKKSYFRLVRKYPPDRYPQEFMRIREAYEILIDENTRKQYDASESMPDVVKLFFEAGREALEGGDYDRAIELLERVIGVYPGFSIVNSLLGDAYYKNGNSGKAIAVFEKLNKDEPTNAGFAGKLAHAYLKRGWHKKAADRFNRALSLDEDNLYLWIGLSDCYLNAKDYYKAREVLLVALESSRNKGWDELELYYKLVQLDIIEGDMTVLNEHLEEMKESARTNENEKENVAWFLSAIAKMLLRHNDTEKARALIDAACELAPDSDEIKRIKEEAEKEYRLLQLVNSLKADESFARVFADMLEHEIRKCGDPNCSDCGLTEALMEMHVISEHDTYRRQIIRLKTAYPEFYQMKKQFFDQVLDKRRLESMFYKYKKRIASLKMDLEESWLWDDDIDEDGYEDEEYEVQQPFRRDANKVGRNDPCPCGSGKKYKKCCLDR